MAFGLVHSLLVMESVKDLAVKIVGAQIVMAFYRLAFTIVSLLATIGAVYLVILIPDVTILRGPPLWRALMYAGETAGAVIFVLALKEIDLREFSGIGQALRYIRNKAPSGDIEGISSKGFISSGIYGRVRNPLYTGGILVFACQSVITRTWLAVSVLAVLYFIFGAYIEQKRMLARYGNEYREYMKRVPLLIPRFFKTVTR